MLAREAFTSILFFLFAFNISGAFARPSYSLNAKRAASSVAQSEYEHSTNAKRIAAGLAPRAPTRVFSARLFNPPRPSPTPFSGIIEVKRTNGNSLGYVASSLATGGRFTVASNTSSAVGISFSYLDSNTKLQLKISDSASYPYIGANGLVLLSFDNSKASLVRTNQVWTGPSLPLSVGNSAGSGATQSFIWNFNPTTKEITANWLHVWGQTSVNIFYRSSDPGKGLYLSADNDLGSSYTRVRFYLV